MIDFRYHLVSIIAIFLSLGLGIVVGTTAINGAVVDDLNRRVEGLKDDKDSLRVQVRALQDSSDVSSAFVKGVAPGLVTGRLRGRDVALVSAPDAPRDVRDAVATMIEAAGGRVVARVRIGRGLYSTNGAAELDDLVSRVAPAGLALPPGLPATRAAAALGFVLAAPLRTPGAGAQPEPPSGATTTVIEAFREAELVAVDGPAPRSAPLVVVVAPAAPTGPDEAAVARDAMLALVRAVSVRAPGVAVVSPGPAGSGGLVAAVRDDRELSPVASTVDTAETAAGQVATVLALAADVVGRAGHYGATGEDGAVPSAEASPAA